MNTISYHIDAVDSISTRTQEPYESQSGAYHLHRLTNRF